MSMRSMIVVAQVAGPEAAETLMADFGGARVYLPREVRPGHPLAEVLGLEAARAICRELGPGQLDVPVGVRAKRRQFAANIRMMTRQGRSAREIARELRCTVRTVHRWRARLGGKLSHL